MRPETQAKLDKFSKLPELRDYMKNMVLDITHPIYTDIGTKFSSKFTSEDFNEFVNQLIDTIDTTRDRLLDEIEDLPELKDVLDGLYKEICDQMPQGRDAIANPTFQEGFLACEEIGNHIELLDEIKKILTTADEKLRKTASQLNALLISENGSLIDGNDLDTIGDALHSYYEKFNIFDISKDLMLLLQVFYDRKQGDFNDDGQHIIYVSSLTILRNRCLAFRAQQTDLCKSVAGMQQQMQALIKAPNVRETANYFREKLASWWRLTDKSPDTVLFEVRNCSVELGAIGAQLQLLSNENLAIEQDINCLLAAIVKSNEDTNIQEIEKSLRASLATNGQLKQVLSSMIRQIQNLNCGLLELIYATDVSANDENEVQVSPKAKEIKRSPVKISQVRPMLKDIINSQPDVKTIGDKPMKESGSKAKAIPGTTTAAVTSSITPVIGM